MSALDVACPLCGAPAGGPCFHTETGQKMPFGHYARRMLAMERDGDVGALEDDDPDKDIAALPDIAPTGSSPSLIVEATDNYRNLTVLRWGQVYDDGETYIYAAIKIDGRGWYVTGQQTGSIPWDVLWNKHLSKALWSESAATWNTLKAPRSTT